MQLQIRINHKLCKQCGYCAGQCPTGAHSFDAEGHHIAAEKCIHCNKCVDACCYGYISQMGKLYTPGELAKIVLADSEYYAASRGGVTFSGGEPMVQYDWIESVIDRLDGVHIAIDTSGYCDGAVFERMLSRADMVLFDVKHMDSRRHKALTGVGNEPILANLKRAAESGIALVIRYPMIPDANDDNENIRAMANALKKLGIVRLEVSSYHDYGVGKYIDIGSCPALFRKYSRDEELERLDFIRECGITPVII
jgi:pyruvate formate lyase activating enzyme